MTENVEVRFVKIPVSLIRQLIDPDYSVYHLVDYVIYQAAENMFNGFSIANNDKFCKDLIYHYYKENLPNGLTECLNTLVENDFLTIDEDYEGFDGNGEFDPENNIGEIREYLNRKLTEKEKDEEDYDMGFTPEYFSDLANEWCRIRAVLRVFNLSYDAGIVMQNCHKLQRLVTGNTFCPIGISFLINYLRNANTEIDRIMLAVLLGINSIIGLKKRFAFTTQSLIKSRMFGFASPKELEKFLSFKKNIKVKEKYDYYTSHRQFDKLRSELTRKGLVKVWMGYGKRTILATSHDWDSIKEAVAENILKNKGMSIRDMNRHQTGELTQMLKQN